MPLGVLAGARRGIDLSRPRIMGILNVTPDSFSDGGRFADLDRARRHAAAMAAAGADLIDVGGESTRPGAAPVGAAEETDRVVPVIEALRRELDLPLSVDTAKSPVAAAAIAAGADFVNDISGFTFDADMAATAAAAGAGVFLMHTRGRPTEMQHDTGYRDLIGEVYASLAGSLATAVAAGIPAAKIALDPGIGFGKDALGNLEILRRIGEFHGLGRPLLLGTSRKNFIGLITGRREPRERLAGTLATIALGVAAGVQIFRVHDVGPARDAALTAWAIRCGELPGTP